MLIPKKMSAKKILQYGLLMCAILGTTGFLIYKNFVAPYMTDQSAVSVQPPAPVFDNASAPTVQTDSSAAKQGSRGLIFNDEKFKELKNNMENIVPMTPENVGRKNPFEPSDGSQGEGNNAEITSEQPSSTVIEIPQEPASSAPTSSPETATSSPETATSGQEFISQ